MPEPKGCACCCAPSETYCDRCDLLVGLPGLRVVEVTEDANRLTVTVESPPAEQGAALAG